MTQNLLIWRWAPDYDTAAKRKKHRLKFAAITSQFAETEDHPAIGEADLSAFKSAIDREFGSDEDYRPFVLEDCGKCVVLNYPNVFSFELVPKFGNLARSLGLNAAEF